MHNFGLEDQMSKAGRSNVKVKISKQEKTGINNKRLTISPGKLPKPAKHKTENDQIKDTKL